MKHKESTILYTLQVCGIKGMLFDEEGNDLSVEFVLEQVIEDGEESADDLVNVMFHLWQIHYEGDEL